ncbi:BtpA/SgcQ family protein [Hyphomonas sp.]|uniref:BtpA/SgcQ family protein n=1 Tax=Hyphomonas sp. TaxID=87 RepID=UPI003F71B14E|tara:strand:- start:21599 stop:22330 length:732 start_codon:yes stop_codon:yes gene_type:complete
MLRSDLQKQLGASGKAVLPVIHVLDQALTKSNIEILIESGAHGCFLINHDFEAALMLPIIVQMRKLFPELWLGVNFLGVDVQDAFGMLAELDKSACQVDGYWADDAHIIDGRTEQSAAKHISQIRERSGWKGLYFGGTAFKYRRAISPEDYNAVAQIAAEHMDVVTTSGPSTGEAAAPSKIAAFRAGLGQQALAIASGITPDNAPLYKDADCFIVATGINRPGNFYEIDPARLSRLIEVARVM